jgi:hypothetical protein
MQANRKNTFAKVPLPDGASGGGVVRFRRKSTAPAVVLGTAMRLRRLAI